MDSGFVTMKTFCRWLLWNKRQHCCAIFALLTHACRFRRQKVIRFSSSSVWFHCKHMFLPLPTRTQWFTTSFAACNVAISLLSCFATEVTVDISNTALFHLPRPVQHYDAKLTNRIKQVSANIFCTVRRVILCIGLMRWEFMQVANQRLS